MIDADQIKKIVAKRALDFVIPHMKVGLGSGSTTAEFIKLLGHKVKEGLKIEAIAASIESENLAKSFNIPLNPQLTSCDIYFDGADEIDEQKNCLKGLGRALFREKILASMSKQIVILVDESKKSRILQRCPLVCEILPFGHEATFLHIKKLGLNGHFRTDSHKKMVITDNGNYLLDIHLDSPINEPAKLQSSLKHIPGVLETGLFFNCVNKILIGLKEGEVIIYE